MRIDEVHRVSVLGAGTMGHGIAEAVALAGFQVSLYDIQQKFIDDGMEKIRWSVSKLVEKGSLSRDRAEHVLASVKGTLSLDDAAGADLIIEAVPEELDLKRQVFSRLDGKTKRAVFASNTSTIPISEMATSTSRPDEFIGIHFFNPPVLMPLVEVVSGERTSQETVALALDFAKKLGKQAVLCRKDVPGFIVNRILGPLLNEAAWAVSRGEATVEQVDSVCIFKVGLPMGLFELADYTGIDVVWKAAESVRQREPSSILGAPLFEEKFRAGTLGRKTGRGFYSYGGGRPAVGRDAGMDVDPLLFFSVAINSAAWLLRNSVCTREDLDLAVKLGLGFPDGILRIADGWGAEKVVATLRQKQKLYGKDYAPDQLLEQMAASGKKFYDHTTDEKGFEEVILRRSPPIAWVVLNRPHRLNAITPRMVDELELAAKELSADDSVRVVVITGEGEKAFSAGADLGSYEFTSPAKVFEAARRWFEVFSLFERMPKPVVAAIRGYALGGGCELALSCDFRVASASALIGQTETSLGLMPGAGGTQRLLRIVGLTRAKEMIYLGERLPAQDALKIGLVDRVFENEEFQAEVEKFAARLAKRAPLALKFSKYAINLAMGIPSDLGQLFEAGGFGLLASTRDASEGISAFLSKTEPEFKGE